MPRRSDPRTQTRKIEKLRDEIRRSGIDESAVQDSLQFRKLVERGILTAADLDGLSPLQAAAFVLHLFHVESRYNADSPEHFDAGLDAPVQVDGKTYRKIVVNALDWLRRGKAELVEELPALLDPDRLMARPSMWSRIAGAKRRKRKLKRGGAGG